MSTTGTLIRGADGSLYFVRDEILKACEVTEPEMQDFCREVIKESGADFSVKGGAIEAVVPLVIKGSKGAPIGPDLTKTQSTVMCVGTMHDGSIAVLPSDVRVLADRLQLTRELAGSKFSKVRLKGG